MPITAYPRISWKKNVSSADARDLLSFATSTPNAAPYRSVLVRAIRTVNLETSEYCDAYTWHTRSANPSREGKTSESTIAFIPDARVE